MSNSKTPCPRCNSPETPDHLAAWDGLCQVCWGDVADANMTPEDREWLDRDDNAAFGDAASHMTPEDWDADNDWLASAGWGEM